MSYFPSQTVSTCNKSRHLRERGKEAVRCCLLASQQATEVIPARQPFYTLLGAKLSLCETWAQSWMTARGQWSRYVAPPLWKLPAKGEEPHNCSFVPVQSSMTAPHCPCAVIHDCAPCGSSPLLEASKGEEPHTCSIVPLAPCSHP